MRRDHTAHVNERQGYCSCLSHRFGLIANNYPAKYKQPSDPSWFSLHSVQQRATASRNILCAMFYSSLATRVFFCLSGLTTIIHLDSHGSNFEANLPGTKLCLVISAHFLCVGFFFIHGPDVRSEISRSIHLGNNSTPLTDSLPSGSRATEYWRQ